MVSLFLSCFYPIPSTSWHNKDMAKSFVAYLVPLGSFNGEIQDSNSPSPSL